MSGSSKNLYEFGAFRLEADERILLRDGEPLHLQGKAFDTLVVLVRNAGHLVSKDALLEEVWADSFVEENNLTKNIYALRQALNGGGEQFIETIPRCGYRFRAEVREVSDGENLLVENQTKYRLLVKEEITETDTPKNARWKLPYVVSALAVVGLIGAIGFAISTTRNGERRSRARAAANVEAYRNYEEGRALWHSRRVGDLHTATLLLEQAVQKDPSFALAHAALADAYAFDYTNWTKAEPAAREAIRLDPGLGEPHATLGFVKMFWEWKLREAEAEFRQAVALSPDYATGHQWYAANLAAITNRGAALAEIDRAIELEPNSLPTRADLCQILYFSRRYDEAIAECTKTLEMDPHFIGAYFHLYDIYNAAGRYPEAVQTFFRIEELRPGRLSPDDLETLREAFKSGDVREFWRAQISSGPVGHYRQAQHYARLGENEKAMQMLETALEKRDFDLVMIAADPVFDDLDSSRRFSELKCIVARENKGPCWNDTGEGGKD